MRRLGRARVGAVTLVVALLLAGCAGARIEPGGVELRNPPAFSFETDTFAFPNDIRWRNPGKAELYANYCFVLARAVRQFHVAARFDPAAPKLSPEAYTERVRAIAARPPWSPPSSERERIVIPGYANLREFSDAEERAVKAGLGGRFWTWVHWTNWRTTFPVNGPHQESVAREIVDELSEGRLVQLLVTNWPKPELNHTVVAFDAIASPAGIDLTVWDPNDPSQPGIVTFDAAERRFVATRIYDTEVGPIRAFRMYYSWFW
jgi:hypothetical protein